MRYLLVEFDSAENCQRAITNLKRKGFSKMEVFMPYPEKSVQRALGNERSPLPWFVFAAGLAGAGVAYWIMWFTNVVDYPLDVGGRPSHGLPAFIPITFETTVLFAGTAAFVVGLLLAGLPRFHHPLFDVPAFDRVMVDGWFLAVDPSDTGSETHGTDRAKVIDLLDEMGARAVHEYGDVSSDEHQTHGRRNVREEFP